LPPSASAAREGIERENGRVQERGKRLAAVCLPLLSVAGVWLQRGRGTWEGKGGAAREVAAPALRRKGQRLGGATGYVMRGS
jgi:hypothetical protein